MWELLFLWLSTSCLILQTSISAISIRRILSWLPEALMLPLPLETMTQNLPPLLPISSLPRFFYLYFRVIHHYQAYSEDTTFRISASSIFAIFLNCLLACATINSALKRSTPPFVALATYHHWRTRIRFSLSQVPAPPTLTFSELFCAIFKNNAKTKASFSLIHLQYSECIGFYFWFPACFVLVVLICAFSHEYFIIQSRFSSTSNPWCFMF